MLQKPLEIKAFFPLQKPNQLFFFFIWVIMPMIQNLIIFHFMIFRILHTLNQSRSKRANRKKYWTGEVQVLKPDWTQHNSLSHCDFMTINLRKLRKLIMNEIKQTSKKGRREIILSVTERLHKCVCKAIFLPQKCKSTLRKFNTFQFCVTSIAILFVCQVSFLLNAKYKISTLQYVNSCIKAILIHTAKIYRQDRE